MPLYDYDCANCGRRFEVLHGVYVEGPTACPLCGGGPVRKAISAAAVHYKGSGWAKKERRASVAPGTSRASGDDGGTSGGEADTSSASEGGSNSTSTSTTDGDGTNDRAKDTSKAKTKGTSKDSRPAKTASGSSASSTD